MESQDVNAHMRCCWDIAPVSLDTSVRWAWREACSDLWSRYRFWKSHFGIGENERTIETGCGYGKFSLALGLSGAQVTLLDYNGSAVSTALEVHRSIGLEPEAIQGDLFDLPEHLLGAFDLVCSFGTLEHFAGDKRRQAFARCTSLLRPGGLLFFTVPNRCGIFYRVAFGTRRRLALVPRDFYEQPFSRLELLRIAKACEMETAEVEGIVPLAEDFDYWIGENARSLLRKLGLRRRLAGPKKAPPSLEMIVERLRSPSTPLALNLLDRRLTYTLLYVGVKPVSSGELSRGS